MDFIRAETEIIDTGNPHVFGYFHLRNEKNVLVLANFSIEQQAVSASHLHPLGLSKSLTNIVGER